MVEMKIERSKPLRLTVKFVATRNGYRFSLKRAGENTVLASFFLPLDQAKKAFKEVKK